jgi:hypothetical protein
MQRGNQLIEQVSKITALNKNYELFISWMHRQFADIRVTSFLELETIGISKRIG